MKTQTLMTRTKEQMKVCSDASALPQQSWPHGFTPAAVIILRLSAALTPKWPAFKALGSIRAGLLGPEACNIKE